VAVIYPSERVAPAARPPEGSRGGRRLFVIGVPILAVVAVVAVCGLIAGYVYESNRRGAETLSDDLLEAIDSRITVQVAGYLSAAVQLAESARAIGGDRGVFDGGEAAAAFMAARLERFPQIAGYSYADPDGNFLYVIRNELGGYDTKLVDRRDGRVQVSWMRRGRDGEALESATDPADTFDARTRNWYVGAIRESRPFWTGAYLFYTLRRPGITYAVPHYAENKGLTAVSGVDIELSALSSFLKRLKIGAHGKALLIDAKGRVIAYPSDSWLTDTAEGAPLPHLDELNDPILTRAFNRLRVEGLQPRTFDIGDERIILSGALKALTGREWFVLIVVPESDFLGFVTSSSWVALALSGVIILLVAGLAAQMMWRSLAAERGDKLAGERRQALETRAQALAELAAASNLMDRSSIEGVREATERAVQIFRAKRVGVWYLTAAGRTMVCEDNFDGPANAHTSGAELHRDEFPSLFAALQEPAAIDARHAAEDARTHELAALYLQPLGVEGVHIAPIHSGKQLLGMLKVEDPHRGEEAAGMAEFCTALASLLALRYLGGGTAAAAAAADPGKVAEQKVERAFGRRQAALEHRLLHHSSSLAELAPGALDRAAVAVIKLPEWLSLGPRAEGGSARMDTVIDEIRRALARSGVDYAALLDDQVVLVAFSAGPQAGAEDAGQAAATAIDIRDRLVELTSGWGAGSEFRIALDVGPVMVSPCEGSGHSLWGGAIAVAKVLAASGRRRAITASETAYSVLSGAFLFRQRGTYFLPETGTMRTFVLVGAL
jgi:adenylate cyclase